MLDLLEERDMLGCWSGKKREGRREQEEESRNKRGLT
jgi:hypothetical protein